MEPWDTICSKGVTLSFLIFWLCMVITPKIDRYKYLIDHYPNLPIPEHSILSEEPIDGLFKHENYYLLILSNKSTFAIRVIVENLQPKLVLTAIKEQERNALTIPGESLLTSEKINFNYPKVTIYSPAVPEIFSIHIGNDFL